MIPCAMCGCDRWEGPRLMVHSRVDSRVWPRDASGAPYELALQFACTLCGYRRYQKTVADGGEPAVTITPKAVVDNNHLPMDAD